MLTYLDDPVYRVVGKMRQPDLLTRLIRREWKRSRGPAPDDLRGRIIQTHYKPFERARFLVEATFSSDKPKEQRSTQFLYLQVFPQQELARKRFESASGKVERECYAPPVMLFEELNTVAWSIPNSRRLNPTRACFSPRRFAKLLRRNGVRLQEKPTTATLPRLVRYVPRKRALFLCSPFRPGGPDVYIKFYMPGQDRIAAKNLKAVEKAASDGELEFVPPPMVFHCSRRRQLRWKKSMERG